MSYLSTIVRSINDAVTPIFGDRSIAVHGICEQMVRISDEKNIELLPSFIDDNGDAQYVGVDDGYDAIIYHRVNNIQVSKGTDKGFGDQNSSTRHTAAISLVVFGQRGKLGVTGDELAIIIDAAIPEQFLKNVSLMGLSRCQAQTTNIILNGLQVFGEEYRNIDYFLKPDQFLFKINYNIESTFLKKCFTKCLK